VRLLPLSEIDRGFPIADALARENGAGREQIREDCHFAAAVDTIAFYCGDEARDLILRGDALPSRKTVMRISRTAPTRQRFEMEEVKNGRRPLDTNGVSNPVFDTVDFGEVNSHLRRTKGKLGVCVIAMEGCLEAVRPTRDERAAIRERLAAITRDAKFLLALVRAAPEGRPCPCDLRRRPKPKPPKKDKEPKIPSGYREITALLNQARSWPKKCVRDLPVLILQVQPLAAEKSEIRRQGRLVNRRADLIRRSLARTASA
jgi:hypothetical protein